MELTQKDRLLLWNQYSILEVLRPEDAKHYRELMTILERGYRLHYSNLAPHIEEEEWPEEAAREVIAILGMFEVVQDSLSALGNSVEGVEDWKLRFAGFDGNNETAQLGYLYFLVEQQERFKHVVASLRDLNSHAPLLQTYREMLSRYKRLGSLRMLGGEQLKELASVWRRGDSENA